MAKVKKIFLHCSDSDFGSAIMINDWHIERGFSKIGYHEVLNNGYPSADWFKKQIKIPYLEGSSEIGRVVDTDDILGENEIGAHVLNQNTYSYGICMIGKNTFSYKVLNSALAVVRYRMKQFGLKPEDVYGHYEADSSKTCPNIDMNIFRKHLIDGTVYEAKIEDSRKEICFKEIISNILNKIFKR